MSNNLSTVMFDYGTDLSPIHAAALAKTMDDSGMIEKILNGEVIKWASEKVRTGYGINGSGLAGRAKMNDTNLKKFGEDCAKFEGSFSAPVKSAFASMCEEALQQASATPTAENDGKKKEVTMA